MGNKNWVGEQANSYEPKQNSRVTTQHFDNEPPPQRTHRGTARCVLPGASANGYEDSKLVLLGLVLLWEQGTGSTLEIHLYYVWLSPVIGWSTSTSSWRPAESSNDIAWWDHSFGLKESPCVKIVARAWLAQTVTRTSNRMVFLICINIENTLWYIHTI